MSGALPGVSASAPARVPLLRGVALALDRRATCRVERAAAGVFIESKEALLRAEAERLEDLRAAAPLQPLVRLLASLGLTHGVRVSGHGRVPPGTGLATEVALTVAATAAALRLLGREDSPETVARVARDALRGDDRYAPDALDVAACVRGGVVAWRGAAVEPVTADPARLEQSLLLADVGVPARRDPRAGELSDDERERARELAAALAARDDAAVAALVTRGWEAACRVDPSAVTPEAEAVLADARACGGAGRPCGGGGGGLAVLWLPVDARAPLEARLRAAGVRTYPVRLDLLGLALEPS